MAELGLPRIHTCLLHLRLGQLGEAHPPYTQEEDRPVRPLGCTGALLSRRGRMPPWTAQEASEARPADARAGVKARQLPAATGSSLPSCGRSAGGRLPSPPASSGVGATAGGAGNPWHRCSRAKPQVLRKTAISSSSGRLRKAAWTAVCLLFTLGRLGILNIHPEASIASFDLTQTRWIVLWRPRWQAQ